MSELRNAAKPLNIQYLEQLAAQQYVEVDEEIVPANQAMVDLLRDLADKKQTQIDNQIKFERAWKRAKIISTYFMAISISASLLTGVIDVKEDSNTIFERAKTKIVSVVGG